VRTPAATSKQIQQATSPPCNSFSFASFASFRVSELSAVQFLPLGINDCSRSRSGCWEGGKRGCDPTEAANEPKDSFLGC